MSSPLSRITLSAAALTAATMAVIGSAPAMAVTAPLSRPRIETHFDVGTGQLPENIAFAPNGGVVVTLAASRQVARIGADGVLKILATMPLPADGGVNTPVLKFALTTGIVRTTDGTIYFLYASGTSDLTGLWKLSPGGTPHRIAALPAQGLPNGLALNTHTGTLYLTDSVLGKIFAVSTQGGAVSTFSSAPELASTGFLGVNGVKIRHGAVWVSNLDQGTVLRIPVGPRGEAGPVQTRAAGLAGIDDFSFIGQGDTILAAMDGPNTVDLIKADGTHSVVLDAKDGLQNPSAVGVRQGVVYVTSAAYTTQKDPNLLQALITR